MPEKIKLAIVDDHLLFRRGIKNVFQGIKGIEIVLEAGNGKEFLDGLESVLPDVVLMDIQMPVMDGITTTTQLKERYPQIKVIVLSMHDEDSFVIRMMELGANGYLLKDTDPDEVEKAIRTVIKDDYYYSDFLNRVMHRKALGKASSKSKLQVLTPNVHLTEREIDVLRLICDGYTNTEIGEKLCLSPRTVDGHRTRIMERTGAKNTAGMVVYAMRFELY